MPTAILDNAFIEIDSNDLSSDCRAVTINYEAESQDETAMGDDTRVNKGGLKNWSMDIEFNQDFGDGNLDSILFPLVGTQVTVKVREDSGSISSSNPEYTGTGLIQSYPPFGQSVGDLIVTTLSITSAGTLSRNES